MARCMARRIRSGTLVGPGTKRKLRPAIVLPSGNLVQKAVRAAGAALPRGILAPLGALPPAPRGALAVAQVKMMMSWKPSIVFSTRKAAARTISIKWERRYATAASGRALILHHRSGPP